MSRGVRGGDPRGVGKRKAAVDLLVNQGGRNLASQYRQGEIDSPSPPQAENFMGYTPILKRKLIILEVWVALKMKQNDKRA